MGKKKSFNFKYHKNVEELIIKGEINLIKNYKKKFFITTIIYNYKTYE